jgi:hypothetical protein
MNPADTQTATVPIVPACPKCGATLVISPGVGKLEKRGRYTCTSGSCRSSVFDCCGLCERPVSDRVGGVCLMHSADPAKDKTAFKAEVGRLLMASMNSRGEITANCARFIFFERFSWTDDPLSLGVVNK